MISSSLRLDDEIRSTVPSGTLADKSRSDASLPPDRPAARSVLNRPAQSA
jgi:hypothetical protein